MAAGHAMFPPGARCFGNFSITAFSTAEDFSGYCQTTPDMVSFLNLTESFGNNYLPAYCINPPGDDGCPYGYCPNSDIAGPLVRISAYLTNLFVAILIFHAPDDLKESFWSQVLTVYSLLITCGISILQSQLTRIHAIIAITTAGSPLSLYITVYAIRSLWGDDHRLSQAVGAGQRIPRFIVITALGVWIALCFYIILPNHLHHFAQVSCDTRLVGEDLVQMFFFLPIAMFIGLGKVNLVLPWAFTLPIQLTILAWAIAIWRKRKDIWPPGQQYRFHFRRVWRVVRDNYPFVQFVFVVIIPFAYWCATIETGIFFTNDDHFTATYGQILAMFVTLPPMVACAKLVPRAGRWFIDLAWVRLLTCRRQRRRVPFETGIPVAFTSQSDFEENTKSDLSSMEKALESTA